MYTLHYAPDNASLIIRLVLEQLGQPYRTELVDRRAQGHKAPAYLALNPAGLIPTLITPDGPISETAAICLWLADRHGAMAPAPGEPARAAFLKWLFFVSNTLHADLRMVFYPQQYLADPAMHRALHDGLTARLMRHYALLDALPPTAWFKGETPSVLDWYVTVTRRWAALYGAQGTDWFDLSAHPSLQALAQRLETVPPALAAAQAEGLGPKPFSAPQPCQPPEGAAL